MACTEVRNSMANCRDLTSPIFARRDFKRAHPHTASNFDGNSGAPISDPARLKNSKRTVADFFALVILRAMQLQTKMVLRASGTVSGWPCAILFAATFVPSILATEPAAPVGAAIQSSIATSSAGTRYGLFDWLDHRSEYGQDVFPEPFLVDDSASEDGEARLDWLHTGGNGQHGDEVKAEVEKGFGLLTLELEVPYERNTESGQTSQGIGNIELGARYPVYQFVSGNGFVDSTLGAAMEVGIPVNSAVSKNTELVPKLFDDLKLDKHFTLQSIVGWSTFFGGGDDGGLQTFEYGLVFGCTIPHEELPLPGVQRFIPMFELTGETQLNKDDPGHNSLLGDVGFRLNLKTIGSIQPRPGFAFVFPIDEGARADLHWGIFTSLVFEF